MLFPYKIPISTRNSSKGLCTVRLQATNEIVNKMDTFLFGTMPTVAQANACLEMHRPRQKRKVVDFNNYPTLKWKLPIAYKYSGSQSAYETGPCMW